MDLITRVLLAATKRLPIPGKLKWKIGLRDEIAWWDGFMAENYIPAPKNPNGLSEEAIFRLDETAPLQDQFVQLLKDTNTERIRILDVGCGPFSLIGKVLPRKELDITAVDPLAEEYIKLQSKHGIVPPVGPSDVMQRNWTICSNRIHSIWCTPITVLIIVMTLLRPFGRCSI